MTNPKNPSALKHIFIPMSAVTLLLYFALSFVEENVSPFKKTLIHVSFGSLFMIIPAVLLVRRNKSKIVVPHFDRLKKTLCWMFVLFGFIWILLTLKQLQSTL